MTDPFAPLGRFINDPDRTCTYSPGDTPANDCGAPATWHIMWNVEAEVSLACNPHMDEARRRFVFVDSHQLGPDCDMPGALWDLDNGRCIYPDEADTVTQAELQPARPRRRPHHRRMRRSRPAMATPEGGRMTKPRTQPGCGALPLRLRRLLHLRRLDRLPAVQHLPHPALRQTKPGRQLRHRHAPSVRRPQRRIPPPLVTIPRWPTRHRTVQDYRNRQQQSANSVIQPTIHVVPLS